MADLQLLIVADDPLARAGLSLMLANEPGCLVVSQINSADVLDELADTRKPDVIIWDVGWEAPAKLPDWIDHDIPVLALLPPFLHDGGVIRVFWERGIRVLLSRESSGAILAAAAHTAVYNLTILDNDVAALLLPANDREGDTAVPQPLTPRETEVLHLLAEGLTNKAIARQLHVSEHTIKFHVNAIMGKLNAQSRTDAVVRATRVGLLAL